LIIQEREALLILRFIIININKYQHCHIILGYPTPKQTLKEKNNLLNPKAQSFQIPPYINSSLPCNTKQKQVLGIKKTRSSKKQRNMKNSWLE
jgi:hypothetical protein